MTDEMWETLDRFLAGELPLDELADRVRVAPELATVLGADDARALHEAIAEPTDVARAVRVVAAMYERHRPGPLTRDRAARIARGMLDRSIEAAAGARALARLRAEGHEWIPEAFAGIAAALDERAPVAHPRGTPAALADRIAGERARAGAVRAPALVAARRLLETLEGGDG